MSLLDNAIVAQPDPLIEFTGDKLTIHPLDSIDNTPENLPKLVEIVAEGTPRALAAGVKPKFQTYSIMAFMIRFPLASVKEVCQYFQVSPGVVKSVIESDMFQGALQNAQQTLLSDVMFNSQAELQAGLKVAAETVNTHIVNKNDPEFSLRVLAQYGKVLGMGTKPAVNVTNNTQINIGSAIASARERYNESRRKSQVLPQVE